MVIRLGICVTDPPLSRVYVSAKDDDRSLTTSARVEISHPGIYRAVASLCITGALAVADVGERVEHRQLKRAGSPRAKYL